MIGKYFQRMSWGKGNLSPHGVIRILVSTLIVLFFLSGWGLETFVQAKTCIPQARSVPGFSGQPPDWWTTGQFSLAYQPEDPRWRGAVSHDYGLGSTSKAEFRALYKTISGTTYMYLSWYVKVTPPIDIDDDVLYVGFHSPGATDGTIIKIILSQTSTETGGVIVPKPQNESGITYYTPSVLQGSGTTSWSTVAVPSWVTNNTRVWIKGTNPYYWAVQMRIPIDSSFSNGLDITDISSFKMWYYIQVGIDAPGHAHSPIIPYTLPRTSAGALEDFIYREVALTPTYPDPTTWADASLQDPESDSSCQVGISITAGNIGTVEPPSSKIDLFDPNTFFAKPINHSTTPVPPNIIKATFRIANWGSHVGDLTAASWQVIPGGQDVLDTTGINGYGNPAGHEGNITFAWTLSSTDRCPFIGQSGVGTIPGDPGCPNATPTRILHQCMFVKLTGPGLDFIRDSVYRNMDFEDASTFSREAEISVVGLPSLAGSAKRDVYLYIEKLNMPEFAPIGKPGLGWRGILKRGPEGSGLPGTTAGNRRSTQSFEQIKKTSPTYVVHAYHDTGKTVTINGVEHPIFMPQTSFGYFLDHEGSLEGWKDSLTGAGLKKLAPYWYKIGVPNNGVATVTTTIKAIDPKFALSARLGMDFPHGTFDLIVKPGLSLNVGLEYLLSRYLSIEAVFGYHNFTDEGLLGTDQKILQFSGNWRYFVPVNRRFRSFINAGAGLYALDPGDSEFGYNGGAGFDFYITAQFALEAAYNYHIINTSGDNIKFSTLQAGFRISF